MKIIIFGIGDLAKQLAVYLEESDEYSLEYFCANKEYITSKTFLSKPVITFEEELIYFNPNEYKILLAIGYNNMRLRKKRFETIKELGFKFINYIHPSVVNYGEVQGEGNIILANATLEPFSVIGSNNIIWSNSVICHDVKIGNHNFIASNSIIGGFSIVNENNFLGFNTTVVDNITVDKEVAIGAKSLVVKNPENYSMNFGIPSELKKYHEVDGIKIN